MEDKTDNNMTPSHSNIRTSNHSFVPKGCPAAPIISLVYPQPLPKYFIAEERACSSPLDMQTSGPQVAWE